MSIGIRKYKESDAEAFQQAVLESVEHVSKWLSWCTEDYRIDDANLWVSSAHKTWENGSNYRFLIENLDNFEILGAVGINQVVTQHQVGNLGYWIRASALNKGYCTQAAKLAIKYAFSELDFKRIEIHVLTENKESNAVALNLGGTFEGTVRNKLMHNGTSMPANCYSVIPDDYGI